MDSHQALSTRLLAAQQQLLIHLLQMQQLTPKQPFPTPLSNLPMIPRPPVPALRPRQQKRSASRWS
jgi:hypothetical protein